MAAELVILPEAERDISDAFDWYENQRHGLGDLFLIRVDACFRTIERNPTIHQVVYKQYRRGVLRQFPYAVLFKQLSDDQVVVYGLFHTSRNPDRWRQRLP